MKFLLYLFWLQLFGMDYYLFNIIKRNKPNCGYFLFKRNLKYFYFRVNYFSKWEKTTCEKYNKSGILIKYKEMDMKKIHP